MKYNTAEIAEELRLSERRDVIVSLCASVLLLLTLGGVDVLDAKNFIEMVNVISYRVAACVVLLLGLECVLLTTSRHATRKIVSVVYVIAGAIMTLSLLAPQPADGRTMYGFVGLIYLLQMYSIRSHPEPRVQAWILFVFVVIMNYIVYVNLPYDTVIRDKFLEDHVFQIGTLALMTSFYCILVERNLINSLIKRRNTEQESAKLEGILNTVLPIHISSKILSTYAKVMNMQTVQLSTASTNFIVDDSVETAKKFTLALSSQSDAITEEYECASVLFIKVMDVDKINVNNPVDFVKCMDKIFSTLDGIVSATPGVVKIENVEDVYICAAGIPSKDPEHARTLVDFVFKVMSRVSVDLKFGICTGKVTAGILGTMYIRYCLFGDTMNTASRMSTLSDRRRLHMTDSAAQALLSQVTNVVKQQETITFDLDNESYVLTLRPQLNVKGKGLMQTYFCDMAGSGNLGFENRLCASRQPSVRSVSSSTSRCEKIRMVKQTYSALDAPLCWSSLRYTDPKLHDLNKSVDKSITGGFSRVMMTGGIVAFLAWTTTDKSYVQFYEETPWLLYGMFISNGCTLFAVLASIFAKKGKVFATRLSMYMLVWSLNLLSAIRVYLMQRWHHDELYAEITYSKYFFIILDIVCFNVVPVCVPNVSVIWNVISVIWYTLCFIVSFTSNGLPVSSALSRSFVFSLGVLISTSGARLYTRKMHELAYYEYQAKLQKQATLGLFSVVLSPHVITHMMHSDEKLLAESLKDAVIVRFDIVGFTSTSAAIGNQKTYAMLHTLHSAIDHIMAECNAVKLYTIGDAYVAVCGLDDDHEKKCTKAASHALQLALLMQARVQRLNDDNKSKGMPPISVRIGVSGGDMIGGLVCHNRRGTRPSYLMWGPGYARAEKMEQTCAPGMIKIDGETAERACKESEDLHYVLQDIEGSSDKYLVSFRQ